MQMPETEKKGRYGGNMDRLTNEQLIAALKDRFIENENAFESLRVMTDKLEDMNRKLLESERMKTSFLSNIRNEMNNPLTSIMGLSRQLVSEDSMPSDAIYSVASMIHSEAVSLDFQLRNIFAAAEIESGEVKLTPSAVDVDTLVQGVMEMFRVRASEKNIAVHYSPISPDPKDRVIFRTDSEKLQVVISNLLSNAIEFSHDGGQVEIKGWVEGGYLGLSVKDNGIGIEKADIGTIFERFKQLDSGSRKRHRGHGLGLSITRDLAGLLLGTISVSSAPGKGSVFTVDAIPELESSDDGNVLAINGNVFLFEEAARSVKWGDAS
jgi:signal transduction histidine kinase